MSSSIFPPGVSEAVIVPPDTVVYIKLDQPLSSKTNKTSDVIQAHVTQDVYLGPYLVIPKGSQVAGRVGLVNDNSREAEKAGHQPYVTALFESIQRPGESAPLPFSATLIAYKTGINRQQYLQALPPNPKGGKGYLRAGSMVSGALTGALINPIFGPPIGAGAGLIGSLLSHHATQGAEVKVNANQEVPISVKQPFYMPVVAIDGQPNPLQTTPQQSTLPNTERDASFQAQPTAELKDLTNIQDKLK